MRFGRYSALAASLVVAAFVGACASGGSGVLSSTTLTSEDLATASYETAYDFLRAHNRARIVNFQGNEVLTVYTRGGNIRSGQVSSANPDMGSGCTVNCDPESQAAQISGTAPAEGGGEALLILDDREFQGNVTQMLQDIPLNQIESLRILRPSETSARYGGDGRVGAVVIVMKGSA